MAQPSRNRLPPEVFAINRGAAIPLQLQLVRSIVDHILTFRVAPGTRLPSSRALAKHLGVSRLTVTIAYGDLVARDFLRAVERSGYEVSAGAPRRRVPDPGPLKIGRKVEWERILGDRPRRRRQIIKPVDWQRYPYPFIYGQIDASHFNVAAWRDCVRRAHGTRDFAALGADSLFQDDPMLIDYVCRRTLPRRGISAAEDEVIITLGAHNALYIAFSLLSGLGRPVAFEEPGYPDIAETLRQLAMPSLPAPVDGEGLDPERLPADAGVVVVTPGHHAPTGATLPMARRRRLLQLAADRDLIVIEDDYEFETSFLAPPSPALKSLDDSGRVIYVGSFSKSIFPGLRLGYLVASRAFVDEARALRSLMFRHPPGHLQRTTAFFLADGHYDAHLKRQRDRLGPRREALIAALEATPFRMAGAAAHGGTSLWVEAPEGIDSEQLATILRRRGGLIEPGWPFFDGAPRPCRFFRMGYSSIRCDAIGEGVSRLHGALSEVAVTA